MEWYAGLLLFVSVWTLGLQSISHIRCYTSHSQVCACGHLDWAGVAMNLLVPAGRVAAQAMESGRQGERRVAGRISSAQRMRGRHHTPVCRQRVQRPPLWTPPLSKWRCPQLRHTHRARSRNQRSHSASSSSNSNPRDTSCSSLSLCSSPRERCVRCFVAQLANSRGGGVAGRCQEARRRKAAWGASGCPISLCWRHPAHRASSRSSPSRHPTLQSPCRR